MDLAQSVVDSSKQQKCGLKYVILTFNRSVGALDGEAKKARY
jgi:hypothetical protein